MDAKTFATPVLISSVIVCSILPTLGAYASDTTTNQAAEAAKRAHDTSTINIESAKSMPPAVKPPSPSPSK